VATSDWSNQAQATPSQGASPWVKGVLIFLAIPVVLWLVLFARMKTIQVRAWPVIRQVCQRLQTDAAARQLFQANPALAEAYRSEEVFLERVQAYRSQFANLSEHQPPEGEHFECFATPVGFFASIQGTGSAWAILEVQRSTPFRSVSGEGLLRLEFSPTREDRDSERRALRKAKAEAAWKRYREIYEQLGTEEGTRALWQREPGLRPTFPDEGTLVRFMAATRPHLQVLPESMGQAKVHLRRQALGGPTSEVVRLSYPFPEGTFTLVWTAGRLSGLEFQPKP